MLVVAFTSSGNAISVGEQQVVRDAEWLHRALGTISQPVGARRVCRTLYLRLLTEASTEVAVSEIKGQVNQTRPFSPPIAPR